MERSGWSDLDEIGFKDGPELGAGMGTVVRMRVGMGVRMRVGMRVGARVGICRGAHRTLENAFVLQESLARQTEDGTKALSRIEAASGEREKLSVRPTEALEQGAGKARSGKARLESDVKIGEEKEKAAKARSETEAAKKKAAEAGTILGVGSIAAKLEVAVARGYREQLMGANATIGNLNTQLEVMSVQQKDSDARFGVGLGWRWL